MKKIKLLMIFSLLLGTSTTLATPDVVYAEEQGIVQEKPKIGNVIIEKNKGGEILVDITEGEVGTLITAMVSPYLFYNVESVTLNGVNLVAKEDGTYQFELVEGANVLNVSFYIDDEEMENLASALAQVKDEGWKSFLTVENLIKVAYFVVMALFSSGFFLVLLKNKKIKTKTASEISEAVDEAINSNNSKVTNEFFSSVLKPLLENVTGELGNQKNILLTVVRCMLLSQENTPEARLAIIKELTELNTKEEELAQEVRDLINAEIKKIEEQKAERDAAIQELKETNEKVKPIQGDSGYGQI